MDWQLQDAKARISALIKQAEMEGPQVITVYGEPAAVVLSMKEYEKLLAYKPSLNEFLLTGDTWK